MDSRPLRLLSLDGGGVKGLTSLLLLREIFRALENEGHAVQPYEYFDLIGGTSTGGLIAVMLGRLRMTIEEAIDAYKKLSPEIFKKKWWTQKQSSKYAGAEMGRYWFEGKNLRNAVRKLLSDRGVDSDLKFLESEEPDCRVFVCAVSATPVHTELLRSYKSKRIGHQNYDCFLWEAVRATSAAPLFFEPITLQASKATFVDGAVRANNPISELTSEARNLWPGRSIGCLISLGTGVKILQGFNTERSQLHEVLKTLAEIATDANNRAREFRDTLEGRELVQSKRYFRYSVPHGIGDVDLADFEKVPYMESMTLPYMVDIDDSIEDCARKLANPGLNQRDEFNVGFSLRGMPVTNKFVAREDDIVKLKRALVPLPEEGMRRKILVLYGLGGIGKTQLAIEFARKHQRDYSATFWLDGSTRENIQQSVASIAAQIPKAQKSEDNGNTEQPAEELEKTVKKVLQWFSERDNQRWLLIIDNVDRAFPAVDHDPDAFNVESFLPAADHGSILITSRLTELKQLGDSHKLQVMNEDQSKNLIEFKTGKVLEDSEELIQTLGGLPLALAQAGAYMDRTNIGAATYLKLYRETRSSLLESELPLKDYPNRSLQTTWTLSFQQLQKTCPDAARMLQLWSYLDHTDLWYELFAPVLDEDVVPGAEIPEWYTRSVCSAVDFYSVIEALLNFSLAESQTKDSAYSVHPVVHEWCHSETLEEKHVFSWLAFIVLGSAVPLDSDRNCTIIERRLLPHCDRLFRLIKKTRGADLPDYDSSPLFDSYHSLGRLYRSQGKLKEAEETYKQALKGKKKALGSEHESTLDTINNLGIVYEQQGQLKEAEEMYERALKGREKALGPEHTSMLGTIYNLGVLYDKQGRLKEAEEMHERALKGKEKALGSEHTSTLDTINGLGTLYKNQGRLKEAEEMLQRALKGYEKALGPEHSSTLGTINNLGVLYKEQGRLKEAEEMYEQALKGQEKALGPEHTSTLGTIHNLGVLYYKQGQLKEAEEMYERALKGGEKALGSEHTSTLGTIHNLGVLYSDQGRLKEAEEMYERALKGGEKALGSEHTSTLDTVNSLGILYSDQGKLKEAEEMYERALKGKEKALGPEHRSTLSTINNLGILYKEQGQLKEAEEMYQRALKGQEKALGSEHTSTLRTINNLGNIYSDQGRLKEAEEMYQRALKGQEKALGSEHTSTLDTVNSLGILYSDQGRLKEAEEMYERALKGQEKALGSEHRSTLSTINNLGVLYKEQGRLKEAAEMYQQALKGQEKALGSEHTSTLDTVDNLGLLFEKQGRLEESKEMLKRALEGYKKARGAEHPRTIEIARDLDDFKSFYRQETLPPKRHRFRNLFRRSQNPTPRDRGS